MQDILTVLLMLRDLASHMAKGPLSPMDIVKLESVERHLSAGGDAMDRAIACVQRGNQECANAWLVSVAMRVASAQEILTGKPSPLWNWQPKAVEQTRLSLATMLH